MNGEPEHASQSAPPASDGPRHAFTGPRRRWTELIRRPAPGRQALVNLLKALVLVYAFLAAINMMGTGVRQTALNPAFKSSFPDAAFGMSRDEVNKRVIRPADLPEADRLRLREGLQVGVIKGISCDAELGMQEGLVAVGDHALPAALAEGLPRHKSRAATRSNAVVRQVQADRVVVEPVCEYKDWLYAVFEYARNPFLALLVGILITAVFQSSSFTTSFTVGLVATISFPLDCAIPIVMGANIGTSVTCVLVSLSYIRRPAEFQRAFGGATLADFYKLLNVALLFTIEMVAHPLRSLGGWIAGRVYRGGTGIGEPTNLIKKAVAPIVQGFQRLLADGFHLSDSAAGIVMTIVAVVLLFASLVLLVRVLRSLVLTRAEGFFDRVLFRNAAVAFLVGLVLTALVQSSSVTTSLAVPLIAAGLLTLRQVFPYYLGANIGTTVTALLAAFATGAADETGARMGLTLACVHTLFNAIGAVVFYPLRWIPIALAQGLAKRAARSRWYAVCFVFGVFFGIPLIGIAVYCLWSRVVGG